MKGFGAWLNESKLGLTDITLLREKTRNLTGWENLVRSDKIGDYVTILQTIPCNQSRNSSIDALYKLWSLYETQEENRVKGRISATGWIAAIIAALLLGLIFWVLKQSAFSQSGSDSTRSVLAFLFGLTTIGVIIIVVVAVFIETGETTLDDRFQRGKDILTILIGLLGAILGYYFGQASGDGRLRPDGTGGQADVNRRPVSAIPPPSASAGTPVSPVVPPTTAVQSSQEKGVEQNPAPKSIPEQP